MKTVEPSSTMTADDLDELVERLEAIRDRAIERKRRRAEQPVRTSSFVDEYPDDPAAETHRQMFEALARIDRQLDERCDAQIELAEHLVAVARDRMVANRSHLQVVPT